MDRIYLSPPHMTGEEMELVSDAFASNWIAPLGPHVDAFEQELADAVGVKAAVALSSGTAALHLALIDAGVGEGDLVMVSDLTFSASVNVIRYVGGSPVFIDSDLATWNLDPDLLAESLQERANRDALPKALIAVDLYGQSADYDRILPVCEQFGVVVIEDAAEALGASYKESATGTFGRCAAFSFNGNKIITTSGGGVLVSDDVELVARARYLATQARDPAPHYQHSVVGYNYRMSNILAAVGRVQLQVLDERVAARRSIFSYYHEQLSALPGIAFMPEAEYGTCNRWLTCVTIEPEAFGADRETVRLALESRNVESRPLWKPMHLQPVFAQFDVVGGEVSSHLFDVGLCLPSGSALTESQLEMICEVVATQHQ